MPGIDAPTIYRMDTPTLGLPVIALGYRGSEPELGIPPLDALLLRVDLLEQRVAALEVPWYRRLQRWLIARWTALCERLQIP